ncbi:MAG TPA: acyl carrier protein [Pseudonocardiaceae bacterium]|jgi:acyl carrier protein|nr:acyl carrier protein [Pseudonocardiaceae bacterium]
MTKQEVVLTEVADMLRATMGDFDNELDIRPESSFLDDLGMESIDVVALAGRLQTRYGKSVNFAQFVVGSDTALVTKLQVGQLVDHIVDSLDRSAGGQGSYGATGL